MTSHIPSAGASLRGALYCSFYLALTVAAFGASPDPSPVDPNAPVEHLGNAVNFLPVSPLWSFTAGYQWRQMGTLDVHLGSIAAHTSLPWLAGNLGGSSTTSHSTSSSTPFTAGPGNANANRTYNDGYVNEDTNTSLFGFTNTWGYDSPSQIQGALVSFHDTYGSSLTTTTTTVNSQRLESSSLRGDTAWNSDLSGSGWFANLDSPSVFPVGPVSVSFTLGYSFVSSGGAREVPGIFTAQQESVQHTASSATTSTTTTKVTDVYDSSTIQQPGVAFHGTFSIPNIPTSRSSATSNSSVTTPGPSSAKLLTADFVSNASDGVRLRLNTVSFGPHVTWQSGPIWVGYSTGLALNVVDWDESYEEVLYVRQNGGSYHVLHTYQSSSNGTNVLPGLYQELNLNIRLMDHLSLFMAGRYDWAGSLHGGDGPSSFGFKLQGASVQGGLTWVF